MQPHSKSAEIATAFAACLTHAGSWNATFFRMTNTGYANTTDLLSGKGTQIVGGRWTPPRLFRSVYGSLNPQTAMAEALGNYVERGIPVYFAMPLVVVGVSVKLQAVLDVTTPDFLIPLGLSIADLVQVDWRTEQRAGREALTQAIGRQAYEAKLEAIVVPSARAPGEKNIVVFPQRKRTGSSMRIENARKLPKKKGKP